MVINHVSKYWEPILQVWSIRGGEKKIQRARSFSLEGAEDSRCFCQVGIMPVTETPETY